MSRKESQGETGGDIFWSYCTTLEGSRHASLPRGETSQIYLVFIEHLGTFLNACNECKMKYEDIGSNEIGKARIKVFYE